MLNLHCMSLGLKFEDISDNSLKCLTDVTPPSLSSLETFYTSLHQMKNVTDDGVFELSNRYTKIKPAKIIDLSINLFMNYSVLRQPSLAVISRDFHKFSIV